MTIRSNAVLAALILFGISSTAHAGQYGALRPFWTDACTAFPDGTPERPVLWQHCCVAHDFKYWAGGTAEEKSKADEGLFDCVKEAGEPEVAAVMMGAVTVSGAPFLPTFFRWGYGWPKIRGFSALKPDELEQVEDLTPPDIYKVPITKIIKIFSSVGTEPWASMNF